MKKYLFLMGVLLITGGAFASPRNSEELLNETQSKKEKKTNHHIDLTLGVYSVTETNPLMFIDEELLKESADTGILISDKTARVNAGLSHTYLFSKKFGWSTTLDARTWYQDYEYVDNSYLTGRMGPVFRIPSWKLKVRAQGAVSKLTMDGKLYYEGRGGFFDISQDLSEKTKLILNSSYDERTYYDSDLYSSKGVSTNTVSLQWMMGKRSAMRLSAFSKMQDADVDVYDKEAYGGRVNYIYVWSPKVFLGASYEYRTTWYQEEGDTEIIDVKDNEHYIDAFWGYKLLDSMMFKISYTYELIQQDQADTTEDMYDDNHKAMVGFSFRL